MNPKHMIVVLVVALLPGGLAPVWSQEKVLVPGIPPLTQETVDLYREMWEWYSGLKFTPDQRRQYQRACVSYWKNRPVIFFNQYAMIKYRDVEKEWRGIRELKAIEQEARRIEVRDKWMEAAQNETDDLSRFLVSVYRTAQKAGKVPVTKLGGAVLVAGDPPLTQALVDLDHDTISMIFDFSLTNEQRQESQRLLIEDWKGKTQAKKREWVKNIETWTKLPTYRNYERNLQRAFVQARLLELFRKEGASVRDRWLLKLYESAYEPGSARNPILVAGKPALTQLVVDRYRDYLEVMLELSISGGFTAAQRKALQNYLVADWKKMRAADRDALLADLKAWSDATAPGRPPDAVKAINALRPRLLAQLYADPENARSRWLLGLVQRERQQFELMSRIQRQVHETRMLMAGNIVSGDWRYNEATGRMEYFPK
jgi:hypothetical protein